MNVHSPKINGFIQNILNRELNNDPSVESTDTFSFLVDAVSCDPSSTGTRRQGSPDTLLLVASEEFLSDDRCGSVWAHACAEQNQLIDTFELDTA